MVYSYEIKKQRQQIDDEACAIYQIVYECEKLIKDRNKCYYSWHVAREALCEIYSPNQQKKPILISPSSFHFHFVSYCCTQIVGIYF